MLAVEIQQNNIWWEIASRSRRRISAAQKRFHGVIAGPSREEMSKMDWHISETCDFLQTYGILLWSIAGSIEAVGIFYKNKLKKPTEEPNKASKLICKR